jgi:hypothetical protein
MPAAARLVAAMVLVRVRKSAPFVRISPHNYFPPVCSSTAGVAYCETGGDS